MPRWGIPVQGWPWLVFDPSSGGRGQRPLHLGPARRVAAEVRQEAAGKISTVGFPMSLDSTELLQLGRRCGGGRLNTDLEDL
jgi:hypothetical protein